MANRTYISFDWAIKKLLRKKSNFKILEGFLSEFLGFDVKIQEILESEANKDTSQDKFDRVDILVKSNKGELILVELQYDSQVDYFHRMVYGISKLITQYISEGEAYGTIRKAYSINIVYFNLGQGSDYLYEYRGEFFGINNKEVLQPSEYQKTKYNIKKVSDIFPKYYIIRVNNFKQENATNPVEEWLYFLKNSEIPEHFKARGISDARKSLRYEKMSTTEKSAYERFIENRRIEMSVKETAKVEGRKEGKKEGRREGIEEGKKSVAISLLQTSLSNTEIAQHTGLTIEQIKQLRKQQNHS